MKTLHYKIKKSAGEWDISTDSKSLGLTDTHMKTRFAPSVQIYMFFRPFFLVKRQNFVIFSRSECSFHGTQNYWHDLTASTRKLRDIDLNLFLADSLVWLKKSKTKFVYISGQVA